MSLYVDYFCFIWGKVTRVPIRYGVGKLTEMINDIKNIISASDSTSAQEYALDLVSNVIQGELAIGYYLEVTSVSDVEIDITVVSPEMQHPVTVNVPLKLVTKREHISIWKRIKEELTKNLKQ